MVAQSKTEREDEGGRSTLSILTESMRMSPDLRNSKTKLRQERHELTDEELNTYILARLQQLGVDLSVLPEDDGDAPAAQRRILASARRFLRATPPEISALELDALGPAPVLYPSEMSVWNLE